MPEGSVCCWMNWTGSFFFLINHASLIPCKDTHISPHQANTKKIMPKAEAIATKVAIAKSLPDLSLPLCTLQHNGNRNCILCLNILEANLKYLPLIWRCSSWNHRMVWDGADLKDLQDHQESWRGIFYKGVYW